MSMTRIDTNWYGNGTYVVHFRPSEHSPLAAEIVGPNVAMAVSLPDLSGTHKLTTELAQAVLNSVLLDVAA